jgi:amino acid permease
MLGLVIIAFVITYVLLDFLGKLHLAPVHFSGNIARLDMGIFQTVAISNSAFQAHYNAPKIFNELGCDLRAHACTSVLSFGAAFAVYSSFAVAGVGLFGNTVRGNVLKNYPAEGNFIILLAWLGMAFSTIFTFPLVFTAGRDSLIALVPGLQRASKRQPMKTHVVLTSSLVMAIATTACMVQDVSLVIALGGATIGSLLCWILPAGVYLKVAFTKPSEELQLTQEPLLPSKKPKTFPVLPNSGMLVMYTTGMVLMGTLSMSVGIGHALGLI